ncbi:hypothetical protein [Peptoniphilus timonensis]|uniref:hypothetical protein n=1 Tax=Peptoniphilus timonensis TaxID=1268254 RepID=UPI0002DA2849|nr:hypothetical protein [Peptoniphilus timonensis]
MIMDLQNILKKFTELKVEEDVLKERSRQIINEKKKLLDELKNISKVDITRRMDELLPYYIEYEFLQKNLKEAEEIESITDTFTDNYEDTKEEKNTYNNQENISFSEEQREHDDQNIISNNNLHEIIANESEYEEDIKAENNTEINTHNKVVNNTDNSNLKDNYNNEESNELVQVDEDEYMNESENTEDNNLDEDDTKHNSDNFKEDEKEDYKEDNDTEIKTELNEETNDDYNTDNTQETTEYKTDNYEDEDTEIEPVKKQKRLFKELSLDEKKQYLLSTINSYRSKVEEIMEYWNQKDNPDLKNKGLLMIRDLRLTKSLIYSEEDQMIIEDIDNETINEVLVKLKNIKGDIQSYIFEKEEEDINNKFEN